MRARIFDQLDGQVPLLFGGQLSQKLFELSHAVGDGIKISAVDPKGRIRCGKGVDVSVSFSAPL